jgi:hypothetical protein
VFGVSQWNFSSDSSNPFDLPNALIQVNEYLKSKGCPIDGLLFKGENDEDTDRQAKAVFDAAVAKISKKEINALGLSEGDSFTYSASRTDSKSGGTVTIGAFVYP